MSGMFRKQKIDPTLALRAGFRRFFYENPETTILEAMATIADELGEDHPLSEIVLQLSELDDPAVRALLLDTFGDIMGYDPQPIAANVDAIKIRLLSHMGREDNRGKVFSKDDLAKIGAGALEKSLSDGTVTQPAPDPKSRLFKLDFATALSKVRAAKGVTAHKKGGEIMTGKGNYYGLSIGE